MKSDTPAPPQPPVDRFRPLSARRRLLIVLLAVAMALFIAWLMIYRPGGVRPVRHGPQPCTAGQTQDCVGGKAEVIIVPAASAPR